MVQVTLVSSNRLSVRRAQGGTSARAFAAGALAHMCGKHANCLVNSGARAHTHKRTQSWRQDSALAEPQQLHNSALLHPKLLPNLLPRHLRP